MSLLLDALKKAAEDKKNRQSDDASTTADSKDDINLDLDIQDNAVFPEVDESLADQKAREYREKEQQVPDHKTGASVQNDVEQAYEEKSEQLLEIEPRAEDHPQTSENLQSSEADKPQEVPRRSGSTGVESDTAEKPSSRPVASEPELSIEEIIKHDQSSQDRDVLKFLINKSNRQSDRIRFRKRLMYGGLATMLLLVLGVFSYFKWLAVSERLYTGRSASPGMVQPAPMKSGGADTLSRPSKTAKPVADTASPVEAQVLTPVKKKPQAATVKKPAPSTGTTRRAQPAPAKKQPIKVIFKKIPDPTEDYLRRAYDHFNAGEYRPAQGLYQQVLDRESKNRDALLGIAAIAIKQKRLETARRKYIYLLQLNPKDSLARAGLSAVEGHMNADLNESQLKLMLREQPEAAHLYFALGSQYAAAGKWAEAQSAFFNAWAADAGNADYAFNLAVSLDHLGKPEQAIEFYRKSLALNSRSMANFSTERVEKRIRALEADHE